jgi:flagellar assembly protein FliH
MSADFIPHGGLIRADDLEQGVPLKPSEITQFIRTIDAEVFEKKHAAAENTFQPKSLFDLAKAASEREVAQVLDSEILPEPEPQIAQEPQDRSEKPGPSEADTTPPLEATTEPQDDAELEPKEELTADLPTPASTEVTAPEPESPEDKATAAAVEEAYQRGFQDGQTSAETEVEQMMTHALGLLNQTTQSFAAQVDGAIDELATSIEASVLSLASSRAGLAIDACPEAFIQRIKTLADRIHTSATQPIVRLNPLDLFVLKPILEQSKDLLNLRLVSDANLQRGDIDLSLEGIRLTDVLPHVYRPTQEITYTPLTLADDAIVQQTPPEDIADAEDAQPSGDPVL